MEWKKHGEEILGVKKKIKNMQGIVMSSKVQNCVKDFRIYCPHFYLLRMAHIDFVDYSSMVKVCFMYG